LEAKFSLTNQVTKLTIKLSASEADIDYLKARCDDLEKREEAHMAKMTHRKEKLLEITQERDDVVSERDEVIS